MNANYKADTLASQFLGAKVAHRMAGEEAKAANQRTGEAKQRVKQATLDLLGLTRGQPAAVKVNVNTYHGTLLDVRIQFYPPDEGERLESWDLYGVIYANGRQYDGRLIVNLGAHAEDAMNAVLVARAAGTQEA